MAHSKPRVLIAASIYPPDPGGPATHAKRQFEWFKEQGFQVEVVALAHYRHWPRWIRHLLYLFALFKKSFSSDIIYAHDAWGVGFIALVVARFRGQKIIMRIGGDIPWERAADSGQTDLSMNEWYEAGLYKSNTFYKLSHFVIPRVDAIVVTSSLLKDLYVRYYGVESRQITVIPNPISIATVVLQKQEKTIVYASRLVAYKNLPMVLRTLAKIVTKYPDITFLIMGDGPERHQLETLAQDLGLAGHVVFKGSVPQSTVLEETSSCFFTLAPALTEFNPNYILQGIGFGKPFLSSRENGFPFMIPEELLFDPRSEVELEEKMLLLLSKEGYERAKTFVRNLDVGITWEDNLEQNRAIILDLLEGQK